MPAPRTMMSDSFFGTADAVTCRTERPPRRPRGKLNRRRAWLPQLGLLARAPHMFHMHRYLETVWVCSGPATGSWRAGLSPMVRKQACCSGSWPGAAPSWKCTSRIYQQSHNYNNSGISPVTGGERVESLCEHRFCGATVQSTSVLLCCSAVAFYNALQRCHET